MGLGPVQHVLPMFPCEPLCSQRRCCAWMKDTVSPLLTSGGSLCRTVLHFRPLQNDEKKLMDIESSNYLYHFIDNFLNIWRGVAYVNKRLTQPKGRTVGVNGVFPMVSLRSSPKSFLYGWFHVSFGHSQYKATSFDQLPLSLAQMFRHNQQALAVRPIATLLNGPCAQKKIVDHAMKQAICAQNDGNNAVRRCGAWMYRCGSRQAKYGKGAPPRALIVHIVLI